MGTLTNKKKVEKDADWRTGLLQQRKGFNETITANTMTG